MGKKINGNIVNESLLEFKNMQDFIKATSGNVVKSTLSEVVKAELKNIINEANDFDEDEVDLDDTNKDEEGTEDTEPETDELEGEIEEPEAEVEEPEAEDGVEMDSPEETGDDDEEEFNFDKFKSGDNEYDLTDSSNEDLIKVFKRINNDDNVIVTDLGDGKIELKDNETDAEYMIDTQNAGDNEAKFNDDDEVEIDLGDNDVTEEGIEEDIDEDNLTEEDEIGSDEEGEGMVDEKNMTQSIGTNRRAGHMTQTRKEYAPGANNRDGAKLIANESKESEKLRLAYSKRLKAINEEHEVFKAAINKENAQLKQTLGLFRDKLRENAVLNNSIGKYAKLVTENATTKAEKVKILQRFANEAKTIEQGNTLFESIQKELNGKVTTPVEIDKQINASGNKSINEQVIYQNTELSGPLSMMKRMAQF